MRTASFLLATSLLGGCVIGDEGEDLNGNDEDIIGGHTDTTDVAVGMLRAVVGIDYNGNPTSVANCTATLISPQVMLTAAHCYQANAYWNDVTFATSATNLFAPLGSGRILGQVIPHPGYVAGHQDELGHDVAIVLLSQPIATRPIARGPVPALHSFVRAVGYGLSVTQASGGVAQGLGTRRWGNLDVNDVTTHAPHEFHAGHEGDNVCHGDSGGPVLQNGKQVGVNSYVDTADCHGGAHLERVDDNLGFIHQYVPGY